MLTLAETRRLIRAAHARMMVVFFAILYGLGSMSLGGMLLLVHVPGGYTTEILWGNALGTGPWNYPGLLVVAPWGVLSLPFLATVSMIIVSVGVGLGVAVAALIAVRLVRDRRSAGAHAGTVGTVAGLTPAMVALVTLGACCSTVAAASAGVGIVAQASGSTVDALLVNNWYLDVFQMFVMFVALIAQELILRVYGGLLGLATGRPMVVSPSPPVALSRPMVAAAVLRVGLLLAGVTWSLAVLAEWVAQTPSPDSPALWFQWLFQHQLLADFAIVAALVPRPVAAAVIARVRAASVGALRIALFVAGVSLVGWTPPSLALAGAPGLVNELFGIWGAPTSWGAVAPVFAPGLALYARWAFQYALLAGFALAVALRPERVLRALNAQRPAASPSRGSPSPARTTDSPAVNAGATAHASSEL